MDISLPELLQRILRQELQQHPRREVRHGLLVAPVPDIREVQPYLADVLEAFILVVEEGGEAVVVAAAEVEGDVAVQRFDGQGAQLFVDEAEVLEVGGAVDLRVVRLS